jgi:hypothetical protein
VAVYVEVEEANGYRVVYLWFHWLIDWPFPPFNKPELPYLVTCTTLGLLAGSTLPASIAKPTAAGLVLAMYVTEMTTKETEIEWVSLLTITHYYPALEIALNNITPVTETATLIVIALALTTLSIVFYNRRDLPV